MNNCFCFQVHLKNTDIKSLDALHVGASYDYRISDAVKVGGTYQRNELYIFPKVSTLLETLRQSCDTTFVVSDVHSADKLTSLCVYCRPCTWRRKLRL
jgi:hypothetical protein